MGITERREREREEVRKKILDAARDLFMTEGYEHVTMRRNAEAIEYSPTAIYLHFEDKDDLVLALCREDFGPARRAAPPQAEDPWVDPRRAPPRSRWPDHYRFVFATPEGASSDVSPGDLAFSAPGGGSRRRGPGRAAAVAQVLGRAPVPPLHPSARSGRRPPARPRRSVIENGSAASATPNIAWSRSPGGTSSTTACGS
jgi:AcrR family transcriptional regulator